MGKADSTLCRENSRTAANSLRKSRLRFLPAAALSDQTMQIPDESIGVGRGPEPTRCCGSQPPPAPGCRSTRCIRVQFNTGPAPARPESIRRFTVANYAPAGHPERRSPATDCAATFCALAASIDFDAMVDGTESRKPEKPRGDILLFDHPSPGIQRVLDSRRGMVVTEVRQSFASNGEALLRKRPS